MIKKIVEQNFERITDIKDVVKLNVVNGTQSGPPETHEELIKVYGERFNLKPGQPIDLGELIKKLSTI